MPFRKGQNGHMSRGKKKKMLLTKIRGASRPGRPTLAEQDQVEMLLDPRQRMMWDAYSNPKSATFCNAYRSAINSGYTAAYARTITSRTFFLEKTRRLTMLSKAERVFDKTLQMDTLDKEGKEQADLLRIQTDVAKHISKTLGKDEGYSERSEVTGKDGNPIVFMPSELFDKYSLGGEEN